MSAVKITIDILMFVGVPLALTHIFVGYLLKPGYCGFIDNGALAPSLQEFLTIMMMKDIWWFGPGFFIETLIYVIVKDKVLAWKLSIYAFHVIAFLVTYYAFKRLYVRFFLKDNRCKACIFGDAESLLVYILALAYAFTEFIKESGRNYFLVQFTIPYIFEPLYLLIVFELLYGLFKIESLKSLKNFIKGILPKYSALLALVGFFVGSNPPLVVSNALLIMIVAVFLFLHHLTKKRFKNNELLIAHVSLLVAMLSVLLSNIAFILQVVVLKSSETMSKFGASQATLYSEIPVIGVLTASRPALYMNTKYAIVTSQQVSLESPLLFYLPLTIFFYVSTLIIWPRMRGTLPIKKSKFLTLIFLGILINVLTLIPFMHGETGGDLISEFLKNFIKPRTPAFLYNSFINLTVNTVCIFTYYYFGFVLMLMSLTSRLIEQKKLSRKRITAFCMVVILLPINVHYYIIQQTYSSIINPTEVPKDYELLYNFVRNHPNATYLWIPRWGLIEWRGVFMSDIPVYLGSYFNVDYHILSSNFVSRDEYYKVLKEIYDGEFRPEVFNGYIILEKKYLMVNQEFYDKVRMFIENSSYFICIFESENVSLYAVSDVDFMD